MKFLIAIEPGSETTAFGVAVPALPGCFSAGDTLEEAYDNAVEAIEAYCEVLAEDGKDMPASAPMAELMAKHADKELIWAIVDVPLHTTAEMSRLEQLMMLSAVMVPAMLAAMRTRHPNVTFGDDDREALQELSDDVARKWLERLEKHEQHETKAPNISAEPALDRALLRSARFLD